MSQHRVGDLGSLFPQDQNPALPETTTDKPAASAEPQATFEAKSPTEQAPPPVLAPTVPPAAPQQPQKAGASAWTVIVGLLGLVALSYWLERSVKK